MEPRERLRPGAGEFDNRLPSGGVDGVDDARQLRVQTRLPLLPALLSRIRRFD